ncbi:MAG: hypothetical protein WCP29_09540 [Acidobacteriota bacterium]
MAVRFALTRIIPSALIYGALVAAALVIDVALHAGNLIWVGRYLGMIGSVTIVVSFAYSLRKRRIIPIGSPNQLLRAHEWLGWVGALMVLVHGGVHFNAWLPWVALLSMMAVVASGLTGKFLLQDAQASLRGRAAELTSQGLHEAEVEKQLLLHSLLVDTMKSWRLVHMPLTMVFTGLAVIHIIAILLFWRW